MFYLNLSNPEIKNFFAGLYEIEIEERENGEPVKIIKLQKEEIRSIFDYWNRICRGKNVHQILSDIKTNPEQQQVLLNVQKIMLLMLSLEQQANILQKMGQALPDALASDAQEINNLKVDLRLVLQQLLGAGCCSVYLSISEVRNRQNVFIKSVFSFEELLAAILSAADSASAGIVDDEPIIIAPSCSALLRFSFDLQGESRGNMFVLTQILIDLKNAENKDEAEVIAASPSKFRLVADRLMTSFMVSLVLLGFITLVMGMILSFPVGLVFIVANLLVLPPVFLACKFIEEPIKHLSIRQKRYTMVEKAETNKIIISEAVKARASLQEKLRNMLKMGELRVPGCVEIKPVADPAAAQTDAIIPACNCGGEQPNTAVSKKRLTVTTEQPSRYLRPQQWMRQRMRRDPASAPAPALVKTMLYLQGLFPQELADSIASFNKNLRCFQHVALFSALQKLPALKRENERLSAEESSVLAPDEKCAVLMRNLRKKKS